MKGYSDKVKRLWCAMVLLAVVMAFALQGSRGLYETTEGRYAESAREMIETGNYLEPTLAYRPHWSKPPLTYWAIGGGMGLLGQNEWGVRLYDSAAFLLTVLAVAYLGTALWDRNVGLVAGFIYSTSLFPVIAANTVTTDTLLTLWETAAVLSYIKACRSGPTGRQRLWVLAMWSFLGLGFLTKGPVSLLPLIPILIRHLQNNKRPRLFSPLGLSVFFLVGFSWYVVCSWQHPGLLSYWLGHEVLGRFASADIHDPRSYKSVILCIVSLGFGPGLWLYFGLKTGGRMGIARPGRFWRCLTGSGNASFLLIWLTMPLLMFCLLRRPLPLYVLPLYVPLTLAIARGICKFCQDPHVLRRVAILALISGLVVVAVKGATSLYPSKQDMKALYQLCRGLKKDQTYVYAFEKSKLYGLQFYLDGRLRRLSLSGQQSWADGSLEGVIREARTRGAPTSMILICRRGRAPRLEGVLKDSSLSFQRHQDRYWVVYSVSMAQGILARTAGVEGAFQFFLSSQ